MYCMYIGYFFGFRVSCIKTKEKRKSKKRYIEKKFVVLLLSGVFSKTTESGYIDVDFFIH